MSVTFSSTCSCDALRSLNASHVCSFYCSITLKFFYPFSTDEDLGDVQCIFNQFFENFTQSVLTIFPLLVLLLSDPPHLLYPLTLCSGYPLLLPLSPVHALHTCSCVVFHGSMVNLSVATLLKKTDLSSPSSY